MISWFWERNQGAGLDVSPAVRDFLEMGSGQRVEWKFVEDYEVPRGPWKSNAFRPGGSPGEPPLPTR